MNDTTKPGPLAAAATQAFRSTPRYATREDIESIAPLPFGDMAAEMYRHYREQTEREIARMLVAPPPASPFSTVANLRWVVAAHCNLRVESVEVEEEPGKGRVCARVPSTVPAHVARATEMMIGREMPLGVAFAIFHKAAPKPDPRAEREARRREIDAVLAEDARRHPAFATARRCAVVAVCECKPDQYGRAMDRLLRALHEYEALRGGGREPSAEARAALADRGIDTGLHIEPEAIAAYERARSL